MSQHHSYKDFAIVLTWPDATIRGDEAWMMFFKKIGLVKNLNFKVGHTGIVLINHVNGEMLFYDFGRYITPRGYGRARSKYSDPLLEISVKANIYDNQIKNLEQLITHFEQLKPFMYGEGKLFFSIVNGINFDLAKSYGDECVQKGTYPYGAVATDNNNCSRFITRMLKIASQKFHFLHGINLPETIKSSPVSNLVNTCSSRMIHSYTPNEGMKTFRMNRWQSLWFLIKQLGDNVSRSKAKLLPNDEIIGAVNFKYKPITIPHEAIYLGGVGDGAWYTCQFDLEKNVFTTKRYTTQGQLEYISQGVAPVEFSPNSPWQVTYDSHLLFTTILQDGTKIKIIHSSQLSTEDSRFDHIQERYA